MSGLKARISAQGGKGTFKPDKNVKVSTTSGYGKAGVSYTTKEGTEFSFDIGKSFDMGKADFPGGSESWKGSSKPDFFVGFKKKYKYGGLV